MKSSALSTRLAETIYADEDELIAAFPLSYQTYFMRRLDQALHAELARTTPDLYVRTRDATLSAMLRAADIVAEDGDLRLSPYHAMVAGFVLAALPKEDIRTQAEQLLWRVHEGFAEAQTAVDNNDQATFEEAAAESVDIDLLRYRTFLCAARVIPPELAAGDFARDLAHDALTAPFFVNDIPRYQALLGDAMIGDAEFPAGGTLLAAHLYDVADKSIDSFADESLGMRAELLTHLLTIYTDLACQHSGNTSLGRAASQCYEHYWARLARLSPGTARHHVAQSRDRLDRLGQGWNAAMDEVLATAQEGSKVRFHVTLSVRLSSKAAPAATPR